MEDARRTSVGEFEGGRGGRQGEGAGGMVGRTSRRREVLPTPFGPMRRRSEEEKGEGE